MSLRRFHIAALAAIAFSASCAAVAAAGPWSLAPGEYYTELRGSFFSSGTYYDDDGNRQAVGGLYEQRGLTSETELGWKKKWSLQMGLPALSNTTRDEAGPTETSTGFGDLSLGLRYSLANGPTAAAIQLGWTAPSGYNTNLEPSLGKGLQRLEASFEAGRPLGDRAFFQGGAGYAYEYLTIGAHSTDTSDVASKRNWSSHVLANAAAGVWMGHLLVSGEYEGEIATRNGGLDPDYTSHLVGPRFTYRVDQRLDAFAGSWHSAGGKNVLHVDQYYAGVAFKVTKLNRLQGFLGSDKRP
jgi:hypothetical protein